MLNKFYLIPSLIGSPSMTKAPTIGFSKQRYFNNSEKLKTIPGILISSTILTIKNSLLSTNDRQNPKTWNIIIFQLNAFDIKSNIK